LGPSFCWQATLRQPPNWRLGGSEIPARRLEHPKTWGADVAEISAKLAIMQ
jgi:hypothetical protein